MTPSVGCENPAMGPSDDQTLDFNPAEDRVVHSKKFGPRLALLGLDLGLENPTAASARYLPEMKDQLPADELLVMLDSSTIAGAWACVGSRYPQAAPLYLLDLSVLTFALLCFDRVVLQPQGAMSRGPGYFEDAVINLEYPCGFIPDTLWTMCAGLSPGPLGASSADLGEFTRAWTTFPYGDASEPDDSGIRLDFDAYDRYQDSPLGWNGIFAHEYASTLLNGSVLSDKVERNEYLSIQTMRTLFNDRLAGYLQVPYLASSFRAPIQSLLLARKAETQLLVDRIIASLGPPPPRPGPTPAPTWLR